MKRLLNKYYSVRNKTLQMVQHLEWKIGRIIIPSYIIIAVRVNNVLVEKPVFVFTGKTIPKRRALAWWYTVPEMLYYFPGISFDINHYSKNT